MTEAAMDGLLMKHAEQLVYHISACINVTIEDDSCSWSRMIESVENKFLVLNSTTLRAMACTSPLS